jgi:hypothetical protein
MIESNTNDRTIPEIKPIEMERNFLFSSVKTKEVPNALSINNMQGDAPITKPEKKLMKIFTSTILFQFLS